MAAVREPDRLTYEDYCAFPDDGKRRELIGGEAYVTPPPRTRHQRVVGRVFSALANHVTVHGGGEVFVAPLDVVLSDFDVVQPDVLFVAEADASRLRPEHLRGAPTLAIEVLSDPRRDGRLKHQLYGRSGVPEYWVVDPDSNWVEVYRLDGDAYGARQIIEPGELLRTPLLPGLEIDLEQLLRD